MGEPENGVHRRLQAVERDLARLWRVAAQQGEAIRDLESGRDEDEEEPRWIEGLKAVALLIGALAAFAAPIIAVTQGVHP